MEMIIILLGTGVLIFYVVFGFISFYFATQTTKEQMSKVDNFAVQFLYWHGNVFMPGFVLMGMALLFGCVVYVFSR